MVEAAREAYVVGSKWKGSLVVVVLAMVLPGTAVLVRCGEVDTAAVAAMVAPGAV
jgi:hypothetical protein